MCFSYRDLLFTLLSEKIPGIYLNGYQEERPSDVLMAIGMERERDLRAVRISLGRRSTEEDVRSTAEPLIRGWENSR